MKIHGQPNQSLSIGPEDSIAKRTIVTMEPDFSQASSKESAKGATQWRGTVKESHSKDHVTSLIEPSLGHKEDSCRLIQAYIDRYRTIPPRRPPSQSPRKNLVTSRPLQ